MGVEKFLNSILFAFVTLVAFCFGGLLGYVAHPLINSIDGMASIDAKEPICFLANMRQANSTRMLTCWMSADWSQRREGWHVSSVSTVRPADRKVVTLASAIDAGLTANNKYFRVYDGAGRFLGWYELLNDQSGVGIDVPIGAVPNGSSPNGSMPSGAAPRGAVGKAPPDA